MDDEQEGMVHQSSVITFTDLLSLRKGFAYQYREAAWWQVIKKYQMMVSYSTMNALMSWLRAGKAMEGEHAKQI